MGNYRGGSMSGGMPVVVGKAKNNTLPKFLNNAVADSSISDSGSLVTVNNPMAISGTLAVSGQLQSTVASGTPAFSVVSNTVIPGLNAQLHNGFPTSLTAVANTVPVYNASAQLVGGITGNAATATALATARSISLIGDVTGSVTFNGTSNVSISAALYPTGVAPGTYRSVTVDGKGRVLSASNPTTLAGYGITDALSSNTAFIELRGGSTTADTAYLDFHSSGNLNDFDVRIASTGGSAAVGQGRLDLVGSLINHDAGDVRVRDKLWIRPDYAFGTSTALHLAIGDNDTGIHWVGDGMLDFYANSAVAMKLNANGYVSVRNSAGGYTYLNNVRPITISTAGPSGGSDGDVWLQY